jgi:hypothetical protein
MDTAAGVEQQPKDVGIQAKLHEGVEKCHVKK